MAETRTAHNPTRTRLEAMAVGDELPYAQAPVQLEKGREDFRLWVMRESMQFWDFELREGVWRRVA